jgi:tetratricopeptide (TPR) repeat protein
MPTMPTSLNIPSNEDEFEILCLKLLRLRWKRPQLQQYGKRGERQHGIDLLDTSGATPLLAAQCKWHETHKTIPPKEIEDEVTKATTFRPLLNQYTILTTARVTTQAQNKIIEINRTHEASGLFTVELLHWRQIEQMLQEFPDLRDELYGGIASSQVARIEQTLGDIQVVIKSTPLEQHGSTPSIADDEAVLDEAKRHLEQHEYQVARLLLQRLKKQRWDVLPPRLRFRLLSNLGAVNLNEVQPEEAAKYFLEAKIFQPEDEKALTNEALAYFLLGRPDEAHALATTLRVKFPDSAQLLAIWMQSAPDKVSHLDLAVGLPEHLLADAAVAVSLAVRAMQQADLDYAEKVLRGIRTGRKDWSTVPGLLGKAILGSDLYRNLTPVDPSSFEQRRHRLREAEAFFTQAIEFARAEKQQQAIAGALLDRSHVRTLSGLAAEAAEDIKEAQKIAPEDPSVMSALAESKRMHGDLDAAILLVRGALQTSPRVDLQYQLGSVLRARGKHGDYREAADILIQLASQPQLPPTGRDHACMMAMDCLCRDQRFNEAQRFLDSLPANSLAPLSLHTIQARLHLSGNDTEKANLETNAAIAAMTTITTRDELEYLAALLSDLGRHSEALPLWQKLVRPGEVGTDPRRLLSTAYRLQRHDIVLETCERLRKVGAYSPDLLQYEIAVLEQYDPNEAIRLLQEQMKLDPNDLPTELHISTIAFRIGKTDFIVSDPSRMPTPKTVNPFTGAVAAQIMKSQGHPDEALKYGYELLRLHFLDPLAHRAYQFVLLPFGAMPNIEEHSAVQLDSAVTVVEDGTGEERKFVIEDIPTDGHRFQDELAPDSSLAHELIGKRVGDSIVLAQGSIASRTGKIVKVLNKYVSRYQDSMSNWQIRFPDDPGIESLPILKKPDDTPDLSLLLASLDRKQDNAERMKEIYYAQPIPIHMFADKYQKNAFQGICMLAVQEGFVLDCSLGSREERADALQNIKICSEIVLEMTAIGTLALLNIESILPTLGIPLLVSQATVSELAEMIAREEMETAEGGNLSKVDGQYVYQERSLEEHQKHLRRLKALLSAISGSARIVPGRDVIALEPSKRKVLDQAFGRYGTEAILLAGSPGRVLWTDDHRLARFAAGEHGVRRVWTQVILQHCVETGKITQEDFSRASAKLIGFEYAFTSLNPNALVSAAHIAEWDIRQWPLKQAIGQFASDSVDLVALLRIAVLFIIQLYREPIPVETRDALFNQALDSLVVKSGALEYFRALHGNLAELFGLNAVGAQQASDCLRRWLESRNFKQ